MLSAHEDIAQGLPAVEDNNIRRPSLNGPVERSNELYGSLVMKQSEQDWLIYKL